MEAITLWWLSQPENSWIALSTDSGFTNISYYKIVIFEGYLIYYIDTGVLLENTPLVLTSGVFSSEDIPDVISGFSRLFVSGWLFIYTIKK